MQINEASPLSGKFPALYTINPFRSMHSWSISAAHEDM
jgi:hypothetical protein